MYCILVAGMPASGKSTIAVRISESLGIPMLSKDSIKEVLFDDLGFHSRAEKVQLGTAAMHILYYAAAQLMKAGKPFILENNFEDASIPGIMALLETHHYTAVTVRLTGDPEVIYRRFAARDLSDTRHRGHVVNDCYPEPPGAPPRKPHKEVNSMNTKYYLAYGSNLNRYQMRVRCPGAKPLGTAVIKNYRLLFKGSHTGAYLTIEPAEGYSVPVAVWAVTEEDERMLDRYEGYPAFYYKAGLTITYKGILSNLPRTCTAFVYIMHEERKLGIPSTRYFTTCTQGYRDFGFDTALLMEAYNHSFYTEAEYED